MCIDKQRNFHQKIATDKNTGLFICNSLKERTKAHTNMRRRKSHKRKRRIDKS